MAAYATAAEFIARYDVRTLGDLASVSGTQLTEGELATDDRLAACLDDASGEIDSAIMAGGRYTTSDLAAMTGNGANYLKSLTCQIAFFLLVDRRFYVAASSDIFDRAEKRYQEILKMLRTGERIFDIEEVKDAGLPSQVHPTSVELNDQNTMTSRARSHFYPMRQLPFGRG